MTFPLSKSEIRRQMLARRSEATAEAGQAINTHCHAWIVSQSARVIAGYLPVRGEADIRPALVLLAERGFTIVLPAIESKQAPLLFRAWKPDDMLIDGPYGIACPPETAPCHLPELLLVPLLAFDQTGHRLGYGKGYYDRTLAHLRAQNPSLIAVGIAYAWQEVPSLPAEMHDQKLDGALSENGVRWFG